MKAIPAIDLLEGKAVRLFQGKRDKAEVVGVPLDLAKRFADEGADLLHVVDLSGAFAEKPFHLKLAAQLAKILPIQIGGGVRTREDIEAFRDTGCRWVIVGTIATSNLKDLALLGLEDLVVAVDIKGGKVAIKAWQEASALEPVPFVQQLLALGVKRILCTTVERDGTLQGPDLATLGDIAPLGIPTIASGGISKLEDLLQLSQIHGIESAVVGKALYSGAFTYAQARKVLL
ncbi:MAG: 1-(5-phosphoribosyl)-5-[(5-phosphoribosylamino)methylideneamino] imidazole-4-carboxamide isomerase [Proteobacteria bacterium]|nr:1-(5-phosphoribosyl)-5-[(5-phosphoribosylamino)methylideneamino] imidazole-4-carboxamide isomerase [Cystobacterineae bacterium]MCL2258687.1 1-(5-phosphoribosyl)-5-[(5-phosphoribosylamino)methylideneamino] imidazole-4-carboxamide isomerase [Cystobacterineae bacterium]MCL2313986.1 1-(5-phosphoribosyl)-5-[(5-phosphoribosylamino)methylideneamino] imidazole-4-carboxamide isomerase [Pseudomonadota bacterium]